MLTDRRLVVTRVLRVCSLNLKLQAGRRSQMPFMPRVVTSSASCGTQDVPRHLLSVVDSNLSARVIFPWKAAGQTVQCVQIIHHVP
jgi:hypothetical protein